MEEKLDEFHYHEMTDRLWMLLNTFNLLLEEHPVLAESKELSEKIQLISDDLNDAYLIAGDLEFEFVNKK